MFASFINSSGRNRSVAGLIPDCQRKPWVFPWEYEPTTTPMSLMLSAGGKKPKIVTRHVEAGPGAINSSKESVRIVTGSVYASDHAAGVDARCVGIRRSGSIDRDERAIRGP